MQILIFYIPVSTKDEAQSLAQLIMSERLAGCANIFPVNSIYPWEGNLQYEDEVILLLKTIPVLKNKLADFISAHHTYKIPCIMNWLVDINESYGNWIMKNILQE